MLPAPSGLKNKPSKKSEQSRQQAGSASSEMFVAFQQTTQSYIPEDKTLHLHV
jgi:hypothetical protein